MVKGKRCHGPFKITPVPKIQFLIDNVSKRNKEIIVESIEETEKLIETGVFPRNLTKCDFMYGKPCKYKDYCWKGDKSMLQSNQSKEKK